MPNQQPLALCAELDRRLAEIKPEDYVAPGFVGIPSGSKKLGDATDQMKRLWILLSRLEGDRRLGETELLKRAAHTAISFEIGKHFNHWRARIGINSSWQVYAVTSH